MAGSRRCSSWHFAASADGRHGDFVLLSFLLWSLLDSVRERVRGWRNLRWSQFMPLGWVFEPEQSGLAQGPGHAAYFDLYKWTWYEWLGALAPLFLFWLAVARRAQARREYWARFARRCSSMASFQQALAMAHALAGLAGAADAAAAHALSCTCSISFS
jgi:hypothetical protein